MQTEDFVAKFICALSKQQHALAGLAFVNDTDLIVNDNSNIMAMVTKNAEIINNVAWVIVRKGRRTCTGEMFLVSCRFQVGKSTVDIQKSSRHPRTNNSYAQSKQMDHNTTIRTIGGLLYLGS